MHSFLWFQFFLLWTKERTQIIKSYRCFDSSYASASSFVRPLSPSAFRRRRRFGLVIAGDLGVSCFIIIAAILPCDAASDRIGALAVGVVELARGTRRAGSSGGGGATLRLPSCNMPKPVIMNGGGGGGTAGADVDDGDETLAAMAAAAAVAAARRPDVERGLAGGSGV